MGIYSYSYSYGYSYSTVQLQLQLQLQIAETVWVLNHVRFERFDFEQLAGGYAPPGEMGCAHPPWGGPEIPKMMYPAVPFDSYDPQHVTGPL